MKKLNLLFLLASACLLGSCKKDKTETPQTQILTQTFVSQGAKDGLIINSSPRVAQSYYAGAYGKEISIGWDASGYAMRGFLSFDVSNITPATGYTLIIDEATLNVTEANTNMNPFTGDGQRMVDCYLVDYGNLDNSDFDGQYLDKCGTIAVSSHSITSEHSLTVTSYLASLVKAYPSTSYFQFRLQFSSDNNVSKNSILTQAMWNIFSGEDSNSDNYPQLVIKYHYEKK